MATSIFPYIQKRMDEALERELENPTVGDPSAAEIEEASCIAGISIPLQKYLNAWRAERPGQIQKAVREMQNEQRMLSALLAEHDIVPLAILPRHTWQRICIECKRYQFFPDAEARVRVHRESPAVKATWVPDLRPVIAITPVNVIVVITITSCWSFFATLQLSWLTAALGIVAAIVLLWVIGSYQSARQAMLQRKNVRSFLATHDHDQRLSAFFPNFCEAIVHDEHLFGELRLRLPRLASDFIPELLKVRRLLNDRWSLQQSGHTDPCCDVDQRLGVAAPAESVSFAENVGTFLYRLWSEPVSIRSAFDSTVVLFLQHGDSVAILAECGEFIPQDEAFEAALDRALSVSPIP
ncbi:MAG: hypothetical protein RL141_860 [Candidatus Parcubacteria bacterium]|jgi:hypothetical protein